MTIASCWIASLLFLSSAFILPCFSSSIITSSRLAARRLLQAPSPLALASPQTPFPLEVPSQQAPSPQELTYFDNTPTRRLLASTLLSLFGGGQQVASFNATLAHQLLSCVHSLVPEPTLAARFGPAELFGISMLLEVHTDDAWSENLHIINKLISWPPLEVADLARRTVQGGGDPTVVLNALGSTTYPVPDVEGANEQKCELGKYTNGRRFEEGELNLYMAFLFEAITAMAPSVGFNVSLSRFDLFLGHMFLAKGTGRLGILFSAREYPAFSEESFPVNLGYCQRGSQVLYDESMNFRNIIWLAPMPDCANQKCSNKWLAPGALFILDAHPGGIIYQELVSEDVKLVRTMYEDDFGTPVVDVNYFNMLDKRAEDRIFIC